MSEIRKCWCGEAAIPRVCESDKPYWIIEHEHRDRGAPGSFFGITIHSYADTKTEVVKNWNTMIDMGCMSFMQSLKRADS